MIPQALLIRIVTIEAALLAVAAGLLLAHACWKRWSLRSSASRLARARATLAVALEREQASRDGLEELRTLPASLQTRLLVGFAGTLQREQRLGDVARALGLVARAEALCRSRWWWRRLRGARLLTVFGGGQPVVPALLSDPCPAVRAQAAEWAGNHALGVVVDRLLELLDDPVGLVRFAVQDALLRGGDVAVEPLRHYLSRATDRGAEAALQVAIGLADPRFLEPGLALGRSGSASVRALAATLVGAIGGGEATAALVAELGDPAAEVRAAAAAAIGRLGHWPAAPALARLLRNHAWEVRREAGLALAALGAPGMLFLRRSLTDEDRFAADMARRVLDVAEITALGSNR